MGKAFSDLFTDSDAEVLEQLEILQEMAKSILEAESDRMEAKAYEDKTLPIVAIVDTLKYSSIGAESGVDDQVGDTLGEMFKGSFLSGLQKGISSALNEFLGNAKAGRQELSQFHVAFDNNTLLRIDIYFYKYEFQSEGLKKHGRNMFCYVAQIGVLNCLKIDPQVTLYELTKTVGLDNMEETKKQLEIETEFAEELYGDIRRLTKAAYSGEPSTKDKDAEKGQIDGKIKT